MKEGFFLKRIRLELHAVLALFIRDLSLLTRLGGQTLTGLLFFITVIVLPSFIFGHNLSLLGEIGPVFVWAGILLANLLGLERLFQADFEDGALDLLRLSGFSLECIVLVKTLAHWVGTVVPMIFVTPLLAGLLNITGERTLSLCLALCLGTPALTCLGVVAAAVTVQIRRAGMLIAVCVVPLAMPVLIFGVGATGDHAALPLSLESESSFLFSIMILSALSLLTLLVTPLAAAAALRFQENSEDPSLDLSFDVFEVGFDGKT